MILKTLKKKWAEYAIEMIVIAISIFAGLQLENWNKYNQEREQEANYLKRLSADLVQDTVYYRERIQKTKNLLTGYHTFIEDSYKPQSTLEDFLGLMKNVYLPSEQLVTQNSTYNELISSGSLNILTNEILKEEILDLHRRIEIAKNHFLEYNTFTASLLVHANTRINLIKYLVNNEPDLPWIDYSNYRKDEWDFINHHDSEGFLVMENLIAMYYNKHRLFTEYLEDLQKRTIQVQRSIALARDH
jgi:hypothetical protein